MTLELVQPQAAELRVQVFDVGGPLIRTLASGWHPAGTLHLRWDGRAEDGALTSPGLHLARVEAEGTRVTQRLVRMP